MTTILVVDNSPVNIMLLRSTFEPFGYKIIAAQNIQEGLTLARERKPDLILSDVHMPGGGGLAVIDQVHKSKSDACFLALSVSDAAEDVIAIIRAQSAGEPLRVEGRRQGGDATSHLPNSYETPQSKRR